MKLRFMHGESYMTYCGKGEYIIDTNQFPELKGMDENQVLQWLYDHRADYGIDHELEDTDREESGFRAYHIVPLDQKNYDQGSLQGYMQDSSVEWDKIKDVREYFRLLKNMDKKEESVDDLIERINREHKEKILNGVYEI